MNLKPSKFCKNCIIDINCKCSCHFNFETFDTMHEFISNGFGNFKVRDEGTEEPERLDKFMERNNLL